MVDEMCRCGHARLQHGDRDNRLEVVPLSMTEADREARPPEIPHLVRGLGPCTMAGCPCEHFAAAR
jgi:hypothetical protein